MGIQKTLIDRPRGTIIGSASPQCAAYDAARFGVAGASYNVDSPYPVANKAFYLPLDIAEPCTAFKMVVSNGVTVSGNFDIGLYDQNGTRLVNSGSTAQTGISTLQVVDITDTALEPGHYWMAFAMDNITGRVYRAVPDINIMRACGLAEQVTAFTLPATATFGIPVSAYIPFVGVALVTTV